jgi:hypothetical protein
MLFLALSKQTHPHIFHSSFLAVTNTNPTTIGKGEVMVFHGSCVLLLEFGLHIEFGYLSVNHKVAVHASLKHLIIRQPNPFTL